MHLSAYTDSYGHSDRLTSSQLRRILDLIDGYMGDNLYYILSITRDDVSDPNGRVDIEIQYYENSRVMWQKLLILKDEIIDGETFHKRIDEWYPKKN